MENQVPYGSLGLVGIHANSSLNRNTKPAGGLLLRAHGARVLPPGKGPVVTRQIPWTEVNRIGVLGDDDVARQRAPVGDS